MKRHHVNRIFALSIIVGVLLLVGLCIYQTQAQEERPRQRVVEVEIGADNEAKGEGAISPNAIIVPDDVIITGRLGVKANTGDFQMVVLDSGIVLSGTPGVDGIMFPDNTVQTTAAAGGGMILMAVAISQPANFTLFAIETGGLSQNENIVWMAAPRSGTFANLFVVPSNAPAAGSIVTITVRVNGADTALAVTHTSADGTNVVSNTVDTVSVSQGDLISVKFAETGGVNTGINYKASFEFK